MRMIWLKLGLMLGSSTQHDCTINASSGGVIGSLPHNVALYAIITKINKIERNETFGTLKAAAYAACKLDIPSNGIRLGKYATRRIKKNTSGAIQRQSIARATSKAKLMAIRGSSCCLRLFIRYFLSDIPGNSSVTITIRGTLQLDFLTLTRFSCFTRDIIFTSRAKRLSSAALSSGVLPRWRTLMATIWSRHPEQQNGSRFKLAINEKKKECLRSRAGDGFGIKTKLSGQSREYRSSIRGVCLRVKTLLGISSLKVWTQLCLISKPPKKP
uniref:Uncharacterized protein n=1 Tax=Cucumis melo TaxID=3656 RepID=A0A9I9EAI1_CUCME